ncbi:hypothetical protein [Holdemania filiformis]|nr:hypothetical protein [Holdemania filiformis]
MKTSGCLRLVRSAAQVIDAGWLSASQWKCSEFRPAAVSGGLERTKR